MKINAVTKNHHNLINKAKLSDRIQKKTKSKQDFFHMSLE